MEALQQLDTRLTGIDERISAAIGDREEAGLGSAIGATLDLGEVLQRTLAAAKALGVVDGSRAGVRRPDGTFATATDGRVDEALNRSFEGPPDHTPFTYGIASWDVGEADGLRSALVVPLGEGSLAVYSRLANAFDAEAARILATIARQAEPAVLNAFRYLEIEEQAATDLRTGLGSASAFEEALPREISAARRHERQLCLIQIDLDDFGGINKAHGQAAGDEVLAEFGKRLRSAIRGSDSAFRNSGGADEFFVILPETTREEARRSYARFAFEMATEPFAAVGAVTMSSGLVELRSGDTPETLMSRADRLALQAKAEGKDRLLTDEDA